MRLRSLFVLLVAALVLVPLNVTPVLAAGGTGTVAPVTGSPWRNSITRRPLVRPPVVAVRAPSAAQVFADRVLQLTNDERSRRGLPRLAQSACAESFASTGVKTLAALGSLVHQGLLPILTACRASAVAENIAFGNVTPEQLVAMWMNSAGHQANILQPSFTQIGLSMAVTSSGRWYGVQVFLKV